MTTETISVGVVLERRPSTSPWLDLVWRPIEAVVPPLPLPSGHVMVEEAGVARIYAGELDVTLFVDETEGYRRNLSDEVPRLFVVLRPDEGGPIPFRATASPYEAEAYQVSGNETVEGVPMPAAVAATVASFVERFHVDQPFIKRERGPKSGGRRG